MDLFMLLLIIMKLKTPIESPGVGISVTVPTSGLTPPKEQYVTLEEILFSTSPLQNLQMLLCQHSL